MGLLDILGLRQTETHSYKVQVDNNHRFFRTDAKYALKDYLRKEGIKAAVHDDTRHVKNNVFFSFMTLKEVYDANGHKVYEYL